jgi:hypothetical protein
MFRPRRSWIGAKTTFANLSLPSPPILSSSSSEPVLELVVLGPHRQPLLEQLLGHFRLDEMLMLGRAFAHRLGGGGASRRSQEGRVHARPADQRLRSLVGGLDEADFSLQAGERKHALLLEGGGELLGGDAVDLVAAVRNEVENVAHLA